VKTITEYIQRSAKWRENSIPDQLLLSHKNPHKPVSTDTIARWIKQVLESSGINAQVFAAHSTRSTSTSKGNSQGATGEDILGRGFWSSRTFTWRKHYRREVLCKSGVGKKFQEKVYLK